MRTFSYFALNREVEQMANVLKAMGVRKGDVVTIYLPRIPEIFFSRCWPAPRLVRCIRWFFAGYSSEALNARIDGSESKVVITVDGSWINGKVFPMKQIVDEP
ncbi:acetyl-coenzyme A synthetase [Cutibacterium acnes JCM 18916]|nr:acetyl-coenzyme A synthetase [Cutibacterium acnes JCM 18916]